MKLRKGLFQKDHYVQVTTTVNRTTIQIPLVLSSSPSSLSLQELQISANPKLTGSILTESGLLLPLLGYFSFSSNQLSGFIPSELFETCYCYSVWLFDKDKDTGTKQSLWVGRDINEVQLLFSPCHYFQERIIPYSKAQFCRNRSPQVTTIWQLKSFQGSPQASKLRGLNKLVSTDAVEQIVLIIAKLLLIIDFINGIIGWKRSSRHIRW